MQKEQTGQRKTEGTARSEWLEQIELGSEGQETGEKVGMRVDGKGFEFDSMMRHHCEVSRGVT